MHRHQISYTNRALILYSLVYFTGFLKERYDLLRFFAQLKWSGRLYMLTAVSGLIHWRLHDWTGMSRGYTTGHVRVEATRLDLYEWRLHDWTCGCGGYMTGHV